MGTYLLVCQRTAGSIQSLKNLDPVPLDPQSIPLPTSPAVCKHIRRKGSSRCEQEAEGRVGELGVRPG